MKEIIVNSKYNQKKLIPFLLHSFPGLSENTLYKALRKKDIRVNQQKTSENLLLHTGDQITLFITDDLLFGQKPSLIPVYEDENILVLNKPAGISVTENHYLTPTLTALIQQQWGSILEPCHRLDYNTSGLILYAKNKPSHTILLQKFKNGEIEKHYHATVLGFLPKKHARLTAYLFKDRKKSVVYISAKPQKNYVKIVTEYTVLSEDKKQQTSQLDVLLHTGKTHQIRAHLAFIGHPILGDGKYGNNETNKRLKQSTQLLSSSKLQFNFVTESGVLNYLNGKTFSL